MPNPNEAESKEVTLLEQFKEICQIGTYGEGYIDIDNKRISIWGFALVENCRQVAYGEEPLEFSVKSQTSINVKNIISERAWDPEINIELDSEELNDDTYNLFRKILPGIQSKEQLKSLLDITSVDFPFYKRSLAEQEYRLVLGDYLAPIERKRLAIMRKDPSSLDFKDVKLRQEYYALAKKLALQAGISEQEFYVDLNAHTETEEFVGGQWLTRDNAGNVFVIVSKEESTTSESTNELLHSAVYLRTKEDAEAGILKKAEQLGYTIGRSWSNSGHNYRSEIGIVIPNYDVSTPEAIVATEAEIERITKIFELDELYNVPKPITEQFDTHN